MIRDHAADGRILGLGALTVALTIAAHADAQVQAWGRNDSGQCDVPVLLGRITHLSAGDQHSAALNSFGGLVMWGSNSHGQCDVPATFRASAIALGGSHTVALGQDSELRCWGLNNFGQCVPPTIDSSIISVGAGGHHSIAVTYDRRVYCWGLWYFCSVPELAQGRTTAVDGGDDHSLALLDDGTVAAWGNGSDGQCAVPDGIRQVVAVAAGSRFSLALTSAGAVRAWGSNSHGQCDVPGWLPPVSRVDAGTGHAVALLADGNIASWGSNSNGQSDSPWGNYRVTAVAAGGDHTLSAKRPLPPSGVPIVTIAAPEGTPGYPSIQQAIDAAPLDRNLLVLLRPGTYSSEGDAVATIVDRSVELASLEGPTATVIDGQHSRRGIVCMNGYGASLKVRGISFRRCRGRTVGQPLHLNMGGGAIRASGGPGLIVENCRFTDCQAPDAGGPLANGSGVWFDGPLGGMDETPPSPAPLPIVIRQCEFERCERSAVMLAGWRPTVESCSFRQCSRGWGAAIFSSGIFIQNCQFETNAADDFGGAVCLWYGYQPSRVTGCTFVGNSAGRGGAMFVSRQVLQEPMTRTRIESCSFIANRATAGSPSPGGGGGGALNQCNSADIDGCTFVGNQGLYGRAIYNAGWQQPRLTNNTFDTCCPVWPLNGAEWGAGNAYEPRCIDCVGDIECDGLVDGVDLGIMLSKWGPAAKGDVADINLDGAVDGVDLGLLLATWGVCPQG
jgi:hypothetical protein